MKAIIMAGGHGSRLQPLTCDIPKPMVPIMNKPIIEHIIKLLKSYNITDIGITLMFLPDIIKDYLGNGERFGVNITYFIDEDPLGTAGSVHNADEFLDDTFVVISGDALTDMNLDAAIKEHKEKKALATLVLYAVEDPRLYGVVLTNEDGKITRFLEKPKTLEEAFSNVVNTGTYIFEPEIFNFYPKNTKFDFGKELFPLLLEKGAPMYGHLTHNYWCDIGNIITYTQGHRDIFDGKINIPIIGMCKNDNIWIGNNTHIDPSTQIVGPAVIGDNCTIGKNCVIKPYSLIGNNNIIGNNVVIDSAILWNDNVIENNASLYKSTVCDKVHIKEGVAVFEDATIGKECIINEQSTINPNVKIWANNCVQPDTIINADLMKPVVNFA